MHDYLVDYWNKNPAGKSLWREDCNVHLRCSDFPFVHLMLGYSRCPVVYRVTVTCHLLRVVAMVLFVTYESVFECSFHFLIFRKVLLE